MIDDVIYFVGSSYDIFLHVRFLYVYVVACFRSDIPIMIVPMISLVAWDIMCRGMARAHDGLMMLLIVGRNHTLRLVVFYDGWLSLMIVVISSMMDVISFMLDGCIMD